MKIELRIGFRDYFKVPTLSAAELKAFKEHVKKSFAAYYGPDLDIYSQTYDKTNKIYLTVYSAYQENGKWCVEFSEQGQIDKRAWVNLQDPHDILVVAYEEASVSPALQ